MTPGGGRREAGGEPDLWRPSASIDTLKARMELYRCIRVFFEPRSVLEVETPVLSRHATVDRHIESFAVSPPASGLPPHGFLATSPEFAMKRLLAAGSGPIFQIARVLRVDEQGRHHNPEFSLLEWYRPGYDHLALMDELADLLTACGIDGDYEQISYREAFERHAGFDPHAADAAELRQRFAGAGHAEPEGLSAEEIADTDFWLDLWMSTVVGPRLGSDSPQFIHDFPASQAALAQIRPGDPPLAERFELFWRGIELANGFHELTDADEQEQRFVAERQWRAARGRAVPPYDRHLIDALQAGLPECAGVALGLDRVLMLKLGLDSVEATLAFAFDRA